MRTWDSIYNYQPLQVWQNLKHCNPQGIRILLVPAFGLETLQKICVSSPLGQDNTTQSDNRTFMPRWHVGKKLGIQYKTALLFSDWSHIWWVNLSQHSSKKEVSILAIKKRQSKANTSSLTPIEGNSSIKPCTLKSSSCSFIFQISVKIKNMKSTIHNRWRLKHRPIHACPSLVGMQ